VVLEKFVNGPLSLKLTADAETRKMSFIYEMAI